MICHGSNFLVLYLQWPVWKPESVGRPTKPEHCLLLNPGHLPLLLCSTQVAQHHHSDDPTSPVVTLDVVDHRLFAYSSTGN